MSEVPEGRRRKLARLTRDAVHEVRMGLTRPTVPLTPEPVTGMTSDSGGPFEWLADGAGALLALTADTEPLPTGWTQLSFQLRTEAPGAASPVLVVDTGVAGAQQSIRLPWDANGRVHALVRLPDTVRALLLGPVNRATRFRLTDVRAMRVGRTEAALRTSWPLALRLAKEPQRIPQVARRYLGALRTGGLQGVDGVLGQKSQGTLSLEGYEDWVARYDTLTDADRDSLRRAAEALPWKPRVSVVMPTYNTPEVWLRRAIDSVRAQLYPHWELCIADDASRQPHVRAVLEDYAQRDARIRFVVRPANGHISAASNSALALAQGEFVALFDHDDELPEDALLRVAQTLNAHPDADIVYSDEDKIDSRGRRFDPYLKPAFNLELFRTQNLISHLGVYRTERVREVGGFRVGFEGSQDHDLALRVVERTTPERIQHVPRVLYHWRAIPGSTALAAGEKDYASIAARKALQEHLDRTEPGARIEPGANASLQRVRHPLPTPRPRVTVILQARTASEATARLDAWRAATAGGWDVDWRVASGSPEQASASANAAARDAPGEVLVFLDADLSADSEDWLAELVSQALRPEVGAVGAKLLAPDGRVEHAGFVLGMGADGVAGGPYRGLSRESTGHVGRAAVQQRVSAVSAACLAVRRSVFESVGGFDADVLPGPWRDVDLCLRLAAHGLVTVWTPHAVLIHATVPASPEADLLSSSAATVFKARWKETVDDDPFHSPNHALGNGPLRFAWPPRPVR
ncbi:glycosyltransferase family 2 protein [Corallococcus terminator]|uniref:Glycosyltransferase n=1 Tax=Corallococcus terminator TaxID=2316733 RepID=A0A3A8ID21_9BACT|nr:glycosyltransferase [Corallococcus terminator]RKG81377.1 glycosyltransferase [Corallococcus terminator]